MLVTCIQVSPQGVETLLNNFNPHLVASPDCIRPIIIKTNAKELTPILIMFQESLRRGDVCYPDIQKASY